MTVAAAAVTVAAAAVTVAAEDRGADRQILYGGSRGDVPFPHHLHQEALGDCQICHETFPRRRGAIEALKKAGDIQPKQVMNKLCTGCHRERQQAGGKSGPTTCNKCHARN